MKIVPLVPDAAAPQRAMPAPAEGSSFGTLVDDVGRLFSKAERAENAFASGAGDLGAAIYERARAEVALAVTTAAASRTVQGLQSILNMQV